MKYVEVQDSKATLTLVFRRSITRCNYGDYPFVCQLLGNILTDWSVVKLCIWRVDEKSHMDVQGHVYTYANKV